MALSNDDATANAVGEKVGVFLGGIGIGYLVAMDAVSGDEVSSIGLLTVTLGIVLTGYFRRRAN